MLGSLRCRLQILHPQYWPTIPGAVKRQNMNMVQHNYMHVHFTPAVLLHTWAPG